MYICVFNFFKSWKIIIFKLDTDGVFYYSYFISYVSNLYANGVFHLSRMLFLLLKLDANGVFCLSLMLFPLLKLDANGVFYYSYFISHAISNMLTVYSVYHVCFFRYWHESRD